MVELITWNCLFDFWKNTLPKRAEDDYTLTQADDEYTQRIQVCPKIEISPKQSYDMGILGMRFFGQQSYEKSEGAGFLGSSQI